jgi:hypothetical protein
MRTRVRVLDVQATLPGNARILAMALLAVVWAAMALPAGAQTDGPPPARDYVSCGHFETQEGAQEVLDSGDLDANGVASLDADGDGIACEDAFGQDGSEPVTAPSTSTTAVSALPKTGSGQAVDGNFDGHHMAAAVAVLLSGGALFDAWRQRMR